MFDLISEISQSLRTNRTRTLLTGLAVAWGIFMLIVLLGVARGVVNTFNTNMGGGQSNEMSVWGGRTSVPYKGYKDGRRVVLKDNDGPMLVEQVEGIAEVVPTASASVTVSTLKDYSSGIEAVYPSAGKEFDNLVAGRFINERDIQERRRVMVIRDLTARRLFDCAPEEVEGKTVNCMGLSWTIVGVYHHRWRGGNFVPYTTYKALTGFSEDASELKVLVEGLATQEDGDRVERELTEALAASHEFNPTDKNAVWIWNRFSNFVQSASALKILTLSVWIIGIFTLLSGIVGVSNIMFVSVRERTHEIGVRRAIGARPRNILTQVVTESIVITTMFGYIGIVLGMIVLQIIDYFMKNSPGEKPLENPTVDLSLAIQVTVVLIIAGAAAGLFPALKALKVKPVEALRDE
ncbi:MAG: ABC transporter permease [Muribaculaceae bacterium]|nr:ABC transporter permease [Muribaculaceae bacterium]